MNADEDRQSTACGSDAHGLEARLASGTGGRSRCHWPTGSASITRMLSHLWLALWRSLPAALTIFLVGRLGPNLREARLELELTQEQVAERSGVHATEVSRIEAGKRDPRVSTVERLAKAVQVRPGQLLE